jgi:hypothetical protein
MSQALTFVSDLKFGHYMKIPPRTMFMAQVVATTVSCFIQVLVLNFALRNIPGVCEPTQPEHFTCPGGRVFFSGTFLSIMYLFPVCPWPGSALNSSSGVVVFLSTLSCLRP